MRIIPLILQFDFSVFFLERNFFISLSFYNQNWFWISSFKNTKLESRSVSLERSTIIVFRQEKQFLFFRFPKRLVDGMPYSRISSTCCRRPSTKRSRRRHFRVKVQRTYSASRTATFVARGGGWHIRVRKYIRGAKEHTHVSPAALYANLRIDQRIVFNVHRVDFAV